MFHFFAYLDRLKLIKRWGLMRNLQPENDMEHSMQVAFIAHGLSIIGKTKFNRDIEPEKVVTMALYHDASEVITGDMPTPVKYMNPKLRGAYQDIEIHARTQLLSLLPKDMQADFKPYISPNEDSLSWCYVKAADRISAYLKCLEEEKMGNKEFLQAKDTIFKSILEYEKVKNLPEISVFIEKFVKSYTLTPDSLSKVFNNKE